MVFDFHVHLFPDALAERAVTNLSKSAGFPAYSDGTLKGTLQVMKKSGIERFAVMNIATTPQTESKVNDFAISLKSEYVFPFGSVHPFSKNATEELKRLADNGIKGVKFHNEYQNFFIDDEKAYPVYEECFKLGLVVLFHGAFDPAFPPPYKASVDGAFKVAKKFDYDKMVIAHYGGMLCFKEAAEKLKDTKIYIDTSCPHQVIGQKIAKAVIETIGFDRVLFATDCPWTQPKESLDFIRSLGFSQEQNDKIFYRNAYKLLGIKE